MKELTCKKFASCYSDLPDAKSECLTALNNSVNCQKAIKINGNAEKCASEINQITCRAIEEDDDTEPASCNNLFKFTL